VLSSCFGASARADDEDDDRTAERIAPEQEVTGKTRVESPPSDTARDVGNALLWLPRNVVDYLFRGTTAAASMVADQQLVPRYREALGAPPGGDVLVFPTLFAETGGPFSVGARMIVDTPHVTTTQRVGFGGLSDVAAESRVIFKGGARFPAALSLELFYKLEDDIEYAGIGIVPKLDDRNAFQPFGEVDEGLYTERHLRALASLGMRVSENIEVFLSDSVARRQIRETEDAGPEALFDVFEPGSIVGADLSNAWINYAEMAMRFDSRVSRARPVPGALIEAYVGSATDLGIFEDEARFLRVGGRVAGFIPIYRHTNILSPRIVYDRLVSLNGLAVPFYELPRQPDFRGFDSRRDNLSMVASLDYAWQLVPFMGMRLFLDGATVAPSLAEFSIEQLKNLRYAGGLGVDLYTDTAQLARMEIATSPEGVRLLLSVGATTGFGDRQHRE
jgi:hypothetical protein